MAAIKPKKLTKLGESIKEKLRPAPEPWPDFSGKMPYHPNPKRKVFKKMPYDRPEGGFDFEFQNAIEKISDRRSRPMGKRTDDLRYKEPGWLKEILTEPPQAEAARNTFRKSVTDWFKSRAKGALNMKSRPGGTGQANRDRLLKKVDD